MSVIANADTLSGSSLSSRLAEPLSSTNELLDLLIPPLESLALLPDQPSLAERHTRSPIPFSAERFARRQLGLVQKILIEKVWPEWESALEAEEGAAGLAVFERFFVPPPSAFASTSSNVRSTGADVAISAYAVLSTTTSGKTVAALPRRSVEIAVDLLAKLSTRFNIEELYLATLGAPKATTHVGRAEAQDEDDVADPAAVARWETCQRLLLSVPTRAANAWGSTLSEGQKIVAPFPQDLHPETFASVCACSLADLMWRLADDAAIPFSRSGLSSVLPSITAGHGPDILLGLVIPRLLPPEIFPAPAEILLRRQRHIDLWRAISDELSERDLQRFMRSVLVSLAWELTTRRDGTPLQQERALAFVLESFFGTLHPSNKATWKAALTIFFERRTTSVDLIPLVAVLWTSDEQARVELLKQVLKVWGNADEIRAGLDSRRLYLTILLLALVVSLPRLHPDLVTLSRSPAFLSAVSTHLSLVAPLQRLLGMLVVEVVSARTVNPTGELKPLDFGAEIWDGDSPEKSKIRELRDVIAQVDSAAAGKVDGWQDVLRRFSSVNTQAARATPAAAVNVNAKTQQPVSVEEPPNQPAKPNRPMISIIDDESDDGFEPLPLPPAPSDATLEALASDDPALYQSAFPSQQAATSGPAGGSSQTRKRGKLRPPVYIPELVAYLKGEDPQGAKEEADGEAERIEMGLREGEALVRRKAGWGGELRENAVDLAFALMGLQNKFELDDFEQQKQALLVALLAACPTEVAPAIIEQYFTNSYSVSQRHVLLASLALAARELAGLPTLAAASKSQDVEQELFPSKRLPPQLHRRLAGSSSSNEGPVEAISADLTRMALSGARADAETSMPEAAREKLLTVRGTTRRSARLDVAQGAATTPTFATIAAETFILPLINRFWLYLRDTATSSLASRQSQSVGPYAGGAPAPMLLEPILLAKFLATLAVLVHAARHSPAFLAVIVPETLAFILAIKPAQTSAAAGTHAVDEDGGLDADLVVSSALELVLVVLDATVQLDGGRTLMSSSAANGEGGAIVAEIKDWAEEVFEREVRRGGDIGVGRPGRAAAGVLLRVEEIVGRWRVAVGW